MENLCQGRSAGLALARTHVRLAYRPVGLSGLGAKEDRATAIRSAETAWSSEMVPKADSAAHWTHGGASEALDRKSAGEGKSVSVRVDLGGRRLRKKKKKKRVWS